MTTTKSTRTRHELHQVLWELAAEHAGQDQAQLTPQTRLSQDLGADSLTITELVMALEERVGVTFPEEVLDNSELTLGEIEHALWEASQTR